MEEATEKEAVNLSRVTTHEVGHLLGVDHSEDTKAVMYYAMEVGDQGVSRLKEDDIQAVTLLYSGLETALIEEAESFSGCMSVAAGRAPAGSLASLVILALLVWISCRVRRESR